MEKGEKVNHLVLSFAFDLALLYAHPNVEPAKLGVVDLCQSGTSTSVKVERRVERRRRQVCLLCFDRHGGDKYRRDGSGGARGGSGPARRKGKRATRSRMVQTASCEGHMRMCGLLSGEFRRRDSRSVCRLRFQLQLAYSHVPSLVCIWLGSLQISLDHCSSSRIDCDRFSFQSRSTRTVERGRPSLASLPSLLQTQDRSLPAWRGREGRESSFCDSLLCFRSSRPLCAPLRAP